MRYWAWTRAVDMWNGWRDGVHGIPGRSATGTPTTEAMLARSEHRVAAEEALAAPVLSAARSAVVSAGERYDHAAQRAATARIVLAELPPLTEAERTSRRLAEGDTAEALVRLRRQREHDRRRAVLQARVDQLHTDAQQSVAALRHAEAVWEGLVASHAARTHRLRAHSRRRLATYWNQLVRRHPDGTDLNRSLALSPLTLNPAALSPLTLNPAALEPAALSPAAHP